MLFASLPGKLRFWAHNASFDKRFIDYYLPEVAGRIVEWRCTQKWLRAYKKSIGMATKEKGTLSLKAGCNLFGHIQLDAHGAFEDVHSMGHMIRGFAAAGFPYPAE